MRPDGFARRADGRRADGGGLRAEAGAGARLQRAHPAAARVLRQRGARAQG
ncbi:hypothetical protein ABMA28_013932, partial [Loxostege sticticalis]